VLHRGECHAFTPPDVSRLFGDSSGNREEVRFALRSFVLSLMDAAVLS